MTHVTINSTLHDILVKCRTFQKLVENNRTQTMVIYIVMHSGGLGLKSHSVICQKGLCYFS